MFQQLSTPAESEQLETPQKQFEEEDSPQLAIEDHLSNSETIEFFNRYFNQLLVPLEMFCEAIQAEFSLNVIKLILAQEQDTEVVLSDFYHEIC